MQITAQAIRYFVLSFLPRNNKTVTATIKETGTASINSDKSMFTI